MYFRKIPPLPLFVAKEAFQGRRKVPFPSFVHKKPIS
jgi:hypothetical protein